MYRGAELFDKRLFETVDKSQSHERAELERIQTRVNEIRARSQRLGVEHLQYHHQGDACSYTCFSDIVIFITVFSEFNLVFN